MNNVCLSEELEKAQAKVQANSWTVDRIKTAAEEIIQHDNSTPVSIIQLSKDERKDTKTPYTDSKASIPSSNFSVEFKTWDIFRLLPPPSDSKQNTPCHYIAAQILKLVVCLFVFLLTLSTALLSKCCFLLMATSIGWIGKNLTDCSAEYTTSGVYVKKSSITKLGSRHAIQWVWLTTFALCIPELICSFRCFHRILFRNVRKPTALQFLIAFVTETMHAFGIGLFAFYLLPEIGAVKGHFLSQCVYLLPSILSVLCRRPNRLNTLLIVIDLICTAVQSSPYWMWTVIPPNDYFRSVWMLPVAVSLISVAWWENFVHSSSVFSCIRNLANLSRRMKQVRSKTYAIISLWKCLLFICCAVGFTAMRMEVSELFAGNPFRSQPMKMIINGNNNNNNNNNNDDGGGVDFQKILQQQKDFGAKNFTTKMAINEKSDKIIIIDASEFLTDDQQHTELTIKRRRSAENDELSLRLVYTNPYNLVWLLFIQAGSSFICYQCSKFSCKTMIQRFSFATAMTVAQPLGVFFIYTICAGHQQDPCFLDSVMPENFFWFCQTQPSTLQAFLSEPVTLVWCAWLLSQLWITSHIWFPECEKLADTDRLFVLPWYSGALVDQSLILNRWRDDKIKIKTENIELEMEEGTASSIYETISSVYHKNKMAKSETKDLSTNDEVEYSTDSITKIYACATMWHETSQEMICMLKSIFRMDEDQCARRNVQKYLKIVDPDYYEFEAHIFFDDAFETNEFSELVVNRFVRQLLDVIDIAAGAVHQTIIRIKAPKVCCTPYGGRMVWTLPGKNKLTVHLKNKQKIRVRKRWSQVMYMYYLLGYRLMEKIDDPKKKEIIAENTYILTLDGDVDFKPSAVHLLIDLMKKNRRLGAACGRMHPRGKGPMVWYQKFEYAIGHWFQKATEHMIGCVLCAPGCFSLFRSAALMDDNVLRRYATRAEVAKEYIQYDQGEDRWLCTLLLQRGYRVEYCAASDALTYAPEGFNEFFNQRRRWIPSTVANIIDLLADYRNVIKLNDSISIWYISYQFSMLVSNILGPGTIFLMVIGAVNISFNTETYISFTVVFIPVALFTVVCLTCDTEAQLRLAQITGALFALLMMAVIVGTAVQIQKDGIYSPHAVFLLAVIASFFIAACLHPVEFFCIVPGVLYFLAIPCMYLLLTIYSVCNLHVVSWGTRETKTDNNNSSNIQKKHPPDTSKNFHSNQFDAEGAFTFSCGNFCQLMCCIQPSLHSSTIRKMSNQLDAIDKKLQLVEKRSGSRSLKRTSRLQDCCRISENQPVFEEELIDEDFDVQSLYSNEDSGKNVEFWMDDIHIRANQREQLDVDEEKFWKDLRAKYLFPLNQDPKHQARVAAELTELRNQISFGFIMVNALFVLIVFLLQIKKDCLYIEWPIGPMINHTVIPCHSDIKDPVWVVSRLQLEPIGLVFLSFFMTLLLLQFIAMLMHRFTTLAHIIASTQIFCFRKPESKLTEDELVTTNAVEIAKELQAIRGVDEDAVLLADETTEGRSIGRRRVVKKLESCRQSMMKKRTETLDAAFKKRFFALTSEVNETEQLNGVIKFKNQRQLTLRRSTIRALEQRRNSLFNQPDVESDKLSRVHRGPSKRCLDRIYRRTDNKAQPGAQMEKDSTSSECNSDEASASTSKLPLNRALPVCTSEKSASARILHSKQENATATDFHL
ncbi:Chitin synthase 3 [Trichinella pseudospiralis]|uniref:chitin synthase n=1 Tax=Trichinella pseudospiralis TaxID=6337 RepID=A0A0V1JL97_TRIPS|nr:Chitin synthase 3 [Trichinella pseudospiralis]KRZ35776.1 Chitin synthase 3 [Trichinella pseudospiralis]